MEREGINSGQYQRYCGVFRGSTSGRTTSEKIKTRHPLIAQESDKTPDQDCLSSPIQNIMSLNNAESSSRKTNACEKE